MVNSIDHIRKETSEGAISIGYQKMLLDEIDRLQEQLRLTNIDWQNELVASTEYRNALIEIRDHPHCDPDNKLSHTFGYEGGVRDGYRCAAEVAREALEECNEKGV